MKKRWRWCFTILIVAFCTLAAGPAMAETERSGRLGVHFQIYGEPHEEGTPIYVNVLPLTYEHPLGQRVSVKAGTILSLRFGGGVALGNMGAKVGFPVYLSSDQDSAMRGVFGGPLVQVSKNLHTSELVTSTAIELGYSLSLGDRRSMNLGGEVGVSVFVLDGETAVRPHLGPGSYLFF